VWTLVLLFFRRWNVPHGLAAVGILLVLVHPAAFFLITSYSESLFLFCLLGFLYGVDQPSKTGRLVAALLGFVMTATRLVGVPLAVYPLVRGWLNRCGDGDIAAGRSNWRHFASWLWVVAVASLGAAAFFAYCQVRFSRWDLYMLTEEVGWAVHADYVAIFTHRVLHVHWPDLHQVGGDGEYLGRLCVPVTMLLFAMFLLLEWRRRRSLGSTESSSNWRQRVGFYLCAALQFYICVSGHANRGLSSMLRFSLPVQVMLVMAAVHYLRESWQRRQLRSRWAAVALAAWCLISFACQLGMTYRFTHWLWVA
jgi:hypothetical protein